MKIPFRGGLKETPIDIDEYLIKCPSCEKHSWADVMVFSRYFQFRGIPIFPHDKSANVICKTCGLKRYDMSLNSNLISNYEEIKGKYKNPWFTYIGITIIITFVISLIILGLS